MEVRKSDGLVEEYSRDKVKRGIQEAYARVGEKKDNPAIKEILDKVDSEVYDGIASSEIREIVERELSCKNYKVAKEYILYWDKQENIKRFVLEKEEFIERYKKSKNNADATVDDNSNATGKNVSLLNAEIHKNDNILISRGMITRKLKELYPAFNSRNYVKDLESHIIYKHDESSFAGPIAPYCVSISMYPFILGGTKSVGGTSKKPENLSGYCGSYCNLLFAIASQYAGAVATPEFLLFFDWFARKEWGDDYYLHADDVVTCGRSKKLKTIKKIIEQHFQGVIFSINSPASSRNSQSPFVNFSYFDKPFFESMFENFYFPDGTAPKWESLNWLQKEFMTWFNEERTKTVLTFPVESFALIYRDGKFVDEESADFVAEELERGHSFFIYISDTADSLSSCCFDGNTRISINQDSIEKSIKMSELYDRYKDKEIEVFGHNPYNKEIKLKKARVIRRKTDVWYDINAKDFIGESSFRLTSDHILPVIRDGELMDVMVKDLRLGDKILKKASVRDEDYKEVEIYSIHAEKVDEDYCYCVEIEDELNQYFVLTNGVITHNCRLKNKIQTKEFSFTNGNIGVETGSKSVITLNLNRITQDFCRKEFGERPNFVKFTDENKENFRAYIAKILGRVYKYHTAYNEYLWDMYDAGLLPVYKAGFIDLNKQYLTIGINGLNQAAEYLGLKCSKNDDYKEFCGFMFSIFEDENNKHRTKKTNFNLEFVPAESLAVKNYNWDKEDGYWVPDDTNLYASYVFKPNENDSVLDRLYMMSNHFAMDKMSGGAAAHINLDSHLSKAQYKHLLNYCGKIGCTYWTVNVPNSECECGYITKHPISRCPKCGSTNITYYDRVIGYLTKIKDWSAGRQIEQKTRVYNSKENI